MIAFVVVLVVEIENRENSHALFVIYELLI